MCTGLPTLLGCNYPRHTPPAGTRYCTDLVYRGQGLVRNLQINTAPAGTRCCTDLVRGQGSGVSKVKPIINTAPSSVDRPASALPLPPPISKSRIGFSLVYDLFHSAVFPKYTAVLCQFQAHGRYGGIEVLPVSSISCSIISLEHFLATAHAYFTIPSRFFFFFFFFEEG